MSKWDWQKLHIARISVGAIRSTLIAESLIAEFSDEADQQMLECAIESETDFFELIAMIARDAMQTEAMAKGLHDMIANMKAREDRMLRKAEKLRELVRLGMMDIGATSHQYPDMTITLSNGQPRLIVNCTPEEAPAEFTRVKTITEVDKNKVKEALKDGMEINFAHLEPAQKVLTIRTK